jgi:hypothetical protein
VALLQEFVPGGRDGWSWCGDAVLAGDVSDTSGGARFAPSSTRAGGHGCRPAGPDVLRGWREAPRRSSTASSASCPPTSPPSCGRGEGRIRAELAASRAPPATPPVLQRVHGDFHIGQILRAGDGWSCSTSRASRPARSAARRPGTALRDVAAMLRSFDHLGRSVEHERAGGTAAVERWIAAARTAFLDATAPVDHGPPARARVREGLLRVRLRRRVRAELGLRARGRACAGSWSTMAELRPELARLDVVDTPPGFPVWWTLTRTSTRLRSEARRVLFIGMGSSRYAALNAAAYLRSLGRDAHAEHASTGSPQPAEQGLLVVAVSAGGGSAETIAAARGTAARARFSE